MEIICSQCGKHLFNTESTPIRALFEAREKGFVGKFYALYGHHKPEYFCSGDCCSSWTKKNMKPDPDMDKILRSMKDDAPRIAEECAIGMARIAEALKKHVRMKHRE